MTEVEYHYSINEAEAKVIARAFVQYNNYLVEQYHKVANTPDVSDFIKEAAGQQYQVLSQDATKLHLALAEAFPELRAGAAVTPA